jgi:hypothetical protein
MFKKGKKIFAIGNSHCHFFSGSHPGDTSGKKANQHFVSYSLGPVIAYNFYEHHLPKIYSLIEQKKIQIRAKDFIMLVVGEVDCRWHLPKQAADKGVSIEGLVKECVTRFFRAVLELNKTYRVITWGGHPSTNAPHSNNPKAPIYGDVFARNQTSLLWDALLGKESESHGIPHVSILKELLNQDGTTKMEFYQDYCHLKTEPLHDMVIEKFREMKILV